jgi:hypothetical protein
MDGSRFDALTRSLTEPRSRRGLTQLVGALALGAPIALPLQSRAKKKGGKGKGKGKGKCRGKSKGKCKDGQNGDPNPNGDTSAGVQRICDPARCDGCCESGVCWGGDEDVACGADGVPCEDCLSQGKKCQEQTCKGCDPDACAEQNGCCLFDTECAPGTSPDACGFGGNICDVCPPGYPCVHRECCGLDGAPCDDSNPCCGGRSCEQGQCRCLDGVHCCDPAGSGTECPAIRPFCCRSGVCDQCCIDAHCGPEQRCHPFGDCVACLPNGANCTTNFGCCSDNCDTHPTSGTFGKCV